MTVPATFDTRKALANVTTETVLIDALAVGDLFYVPGNTADIEPWRVRALDRFPGGRVNVIASPGALLHRATGQSVGVWDGDLQTVKRVVL